MARRRTVRKSGPICPTCGCGHFWICGLLAFIFGFVLNMGYGWDMAFMAVGILIILKALIFKGRM